MQYTIVALRERLVRMQGYWWGTLNMFLIHTLIVFLADEKGTWSYRLLFIYAIPVLIGLLLTIRKTKREVESRNHSTFSRKE